MVLLLEKDGGLVERNYAIELNIHLSIRFGIGTWWLA